MDASYQRRITEAEECVKRAESHLKTSLVKLKWKADWDSAAVEYNRAAVCYKNAGELALCRDAFVKSAQMQHNNGNLFHSAKCKESAAQAAHELGALDSAMELSETAAEDYMEAGSAESAVTALHKSAVWLESSEPDKAIQVYNKALCLAQLTEPSRVSNQLLHSVTRLHLQLEHYSDALCTLRTQLEACNPQDGQQAVQLTLAMVLVQLANSDPTGATSTLHTAYRYEGVQSSAEASICSCLIAAFQRGEAQQVADILQRPVLRAMDNQYLRLLTKVQSLCVEQEEEDDLK